MIPIYNINKHVLGGEASSLNRMLLYRDCNFNLLSLSSNKTNNQTNKQTNIEINYQTSVQESNVFVLGSNVFQEVNLFQGV